MDDGWIRFLVRGVVANPPDESLLVIEYADRRGGAGIVLDPERIARYGSALAAAAASRAVHRVDGVGVPRGIVACEDDLGLDRLLDVVRNGQTVPPGPDPTA